MLKSDLHCCGMADIAVEGVPPIESLREFWEDWYFTQEYSYRPPIIILSERRRAPVASRVVELIRKHKLGSVVMTPIVHNPNSNNRIRAFLWTPNVKSLKAFAKKQGWPVDLDANKDDFKYGGW